MLGFGNFELASRFCTAFDEVHHYFTNEGLMSSAERRTLFMSRWRNLINHVSAALREQRARRIEVLARGLEVATPLRDLGEPLVAAALVDHEAHVRPRRPLEAGTEVLLRLVERQPEAQRESAACHVGGVKRPDSEAHPRACAVQVIFVTAFFQITLRAFRSAGRVRSAASGSSRTACSKSPRKSAARAGTRDASRSSTGASSVRVMVAANLPTGRLSGSAASGAPAVG